MQLCFSDSQALVLRMVFCSPCREVPFLMENLTWGGEREGLKEEEEEERLCRDPKAAPLLQARPYLKLSSPPSPRERGRSRELGVGEKETERGNQRKLQKSMAWNQRQPQQLQCDFDSPIITLN